ncbi:MAG: hypothetical protein Q4C00_05415, partial [Bacillota bacterium]|nr:hypothetical protein [Bacillota bacterium]
MTKRLNLKIFFIAAIALAVAVGVFFACQGFLYLSKDKNWEISSQVRSVVGAPQQCVVKLKITEDEAFHSLSEDCTIVAYVTSDDDYMIVPGSEEVFLLHT